MNGGVKMKMKNMEKEADELSNLLYIIEAIVNAKMD